MTAEEAFFTETNIVTGPYSAALAVGEQAYDFWSMTQLAENQTYGRRDV